MAMTQGDPTWSFGDRVRKARRTAGITQLELALRIGVKAKQLANWESGLSRPRSAHFVATAQAISEATGVSVFFLLDLEQPPGVTPPAPPPTNGSGSGSVHPFPPLDEEDDGDIGDSGGTAFTRCTSSCAAA